MYQFFLVEGGTAAIEYALLISLIGIAIAGFLQIVGLNIWESLITIEGVLSNVQMPQTT